MIIKYKTDGETKNREKLKFAYSWIDKKGIEHFCRDYDEAEQALHNGNFIRLMIVDKEHQDGSDRMAC